MDPETRKKDILSETENQTFAKAETEGEIPQEDLDGVAGGTAFESVYQV